MKIAVNHLLGATALLLHLLSPSVALAQTAKPGEVTTALSISGLHQFDTDLDQGGDFNWSGVQAGASITRPISAYNDDRKMECFLCTEVPTIANGRAKTVDLGGGKKGMTVRFTLHPQAQWADGTPITSKDVAFSWSVGVKPESGFARPDLFQRITKVEVIDANAMLHRHR